MEGWKVWRGCGLLVVHADRSLQGLALFHGAVMSLWMYAWIEGGTDMAFTHIHPGLTPYIVFSTMLRHASLIIAWPS